jgi:hypothetical protein
VLVRAEVIEIADACAFGCKPRGEMGDVPVVAVVAVVVVGVVWMMGVTSNDADELRGLYGGLPREASMLEPRGAYNEPGRGRRFTPLPPPPTPTLSSAVARE